MSFRTTTNAVAALAASVLALSMVVWMVDAGTRPASVFADSWPAEAAHVTSR
jgi:hypothetical protein